MFGRNGNPDKKGTETVIRWVAFIYHLVGMVIPIRRELKPIYPILFKELEYRRNGNPDKKGAYLGKGDRLLFRRTKTYSCLIIKMKTDIIEMKTY